MTISFTKIVPYKDKETIIAFRKDAHLCSFGNTDSFDEDLYLSWINKCINKFPAGFVFIENNKKEIGQVELQIVNIDGNDVGFINLFYLIPEFRGKGYGDILKSYAEQFFAQNNVKEYHLRVSPTNKNAIKFYEKIGLVKYKEEQNPQPLLSFYKKLGS